MCVAVLRAGMGRGTVRAADPHHYHDHDYAAGPGGRVVLAEQCSAVPGGPVMVLWTLGGRLVAGLGCVPNKTSRSLGSWADV